MVNLADLIAANAVLFRVKVQQKNELLQIMVDTAASVYGVDALATYESTLERERLGSTGVGDGIAIPHARLKGLTAPTAVLAVLESGIDFDAPDGRPADIVVLLLSPDEAGADHLRALAKVARLMRKPEVRDGIRNARTAAAVYSLTAQPTTSVAA
jgi:nitrogen PTS system EIIA component